MTYRANVIFSEDTWHSLKKLRRGERSKLIDSAVQDWFKWQKRHRASQVLDALRQGLPRIPHKRVMSVLKNQRKKIKK